jgi:GNAT superfamily N-acetyltransferase
VSVFRIKPLEPGTERTNFSSGSQPLDKYFKEQVTQDIKRRVASCFVALDQDQVAAYYTLASASILLTDLPSEIAKKLPRYPSVPAVRMGRLAVDQTYKGQGLGASMLADAIQRVARAEIAAYALLVDAKDQSAEAFYKHHGFLELKPLILFFPMASFKQA